MGHDAKQNPFSKEHKPAREGVIEARGRTLAIGDEIMLIVPTPIYFRVINIAPLLDPRLPPNLLKIEVAAGIHWHAVNGQVNPEFLLIRRAEEAGPMLLKKLEEAASPEAEPPTDMSPLVTP